jgi:hypothetical protein
MAFVGLKHPVFAPIATEPAGSLPTYGAGLVVGHAIEANVSIEHADAKLYADDVIVESDNSFLSGSITVGIDDLSKEATVAWLGSKEVTVNGQAVVRDGGAISSPLGGFGYYRVRKKDGIRQIRAFWYYKTQWGMPSEESKSKGETIEWQTPSIEGDIMAIDDADNTWRDWADFSTEAAAIAWLNELANIGEPASKTALNAAITSAQALDPETYTSASWVDVANALEDAVAVAAMESPSQARVDSATSLLTTAVGLLVERS